MAVVQTKREENKKEKWKAKSIREETRISDQIICTLIKKH